MAAEFSPVRHAVIALMTLLGPSSTCPTMICEEGRRLRQARRRISATSIGRSTKEAPARTIAGAGAPSNPGGMDLERQSIERTLRRPDRVGRDLRIAGRRRQIVYDRAEPE